MITQPTAIELGPDVNGEAAPPSLAKKFFNIRTLISFAVAFAILYFVFEKMDLDVADIVSHIRRANPVVYRRSPLASRRP